MVDPLIPVIDIGPYRAGDPAATKRVADAVGAACERIGFLVIEGHGVPDALVRRGVDVSLACFDLPLPEKPAIRSDDPAIPPGSGPGNRHPRPRGGPLPGPLRAGPPTDFGSLTILAINAAPGGLQVLFPDETWHDVRPAPGQFVVNVGDMMGRWTNDRWKSSVH